MFVIREHHMEAFSQAAEQGFEDRLVEHLQARFARECSELGEDQVRRRIRAGVHRAKRYEITSERDVAQFIRFMFGIGQDFDTSRKTRWARRVLADTNVPGHIRLERIKRMARECRQ